MKVAELVALLQTFDQSLDVLSVRYSDLQDMTPDDLYVGEGVRKRGYLMRVYPNQKPTMSTNDQHSAKRYVIFEGN